MNAHDPYLLPGSPTTEEALVSDNGATRILARAMSSTWMQHFQVWLEDEVKRGDATNLLFALAQMQIMTHASVAAGLVKAKSYPATLQLYSEMLSRHYVNHAEKAAAASRALREAGR